MTDPTHRADDPAPEAEAADGKPEAEAADGEPTGRRLLAYTVGCCLAGASLALFALSRVWSVQLTARPGLSDLRTARTGGAELPWLPALALVALAGAGALLATRGVARRAVGVLLAVVGVAMAVGAVAARAGLDPGAAGPGATLWPVACVLGAAAVTLGGWWAVRHGHRWPAMGARYERRTVGRATAAGAAPAGQTPVDQPRADTRDAWDALDRGEDPTVT
jgi:uncharacterized membrane protein (TIGR02234 family)